MMQQVEESAHVKSCSQEKRRGSHRLCLREELRGRLTGAKWNLAHLDKRGV